MSKKYIVCLTDAERASCEAMIDNDSGHVVDRPRLRMAGWSRGRYDTPNKEAR